MKTNILFTALLAVSISANAQAVNDTVLTGASYANQVWYSLENDEQGSAPKNNWDLAFDATSMGATVLVNSAAGLKLYNYPNGDISAWASVDTTGLSAWAARYNSDTSWAMGAMGRYADATNPFDMDWGVYNMTTHVVAGDSLYIVKLVDGSYRKLKIESLASGTYTFVYANIDGTDEHTATINKTSYSGKNFAYYSLSANASLDREPASANWQLLFGQYTAFVPSAYTVTGVLLNKGVEAAKVTEIADVTTYDDYAAHTLVTPINTIGYNWKTFSGGAYEIADSTLFFVKTQTDDIWKVVMTGFTGSTDGGFQLSKEKLTSSTSVLHAGTAKLAVTTYPNPATDKLTVVYDITTAVNTLQLAIVDMAGRNVVSTVLPSASGFWQHTIDVSQLSNGIYKLVLQADGVATAQTISIAK